MVSNSPSTVSPKIQKVRSPCSGIDEAQSWPVMLKSLRVVCAAIAEVSLLPLAHVMELDDLVGLFDSVQSVEVAIIVEKELGLSLEDVDLMDNPRIPAICEKLVTMLSAQGQGAAATAAVPL